MYSSCEVEILNKEDKCINEVYLCVESEKDKYSFYALKWDFEKLLQVNSRIKMFLYQVKKENYEKYSSYFKEMVKKSSSSPNGDKYIFAAFIRNEGKFNVTVLEKKDGSINVIKQF